MNAHSVALFVVGGLDLAICSTSMPMSAVNLFLIGRTSLIHPNLKLLLLGQSASIFTRSFGRFFIDLLKFVYLDPLSSENYEPWHTIYAFGTYCKNFLMLILIIERIMATVMIKNYEKRRHVLLFCTLEAIAIFFAYLNAHTGAKITGMAMANLLTNAVMVPLGIAELVLFYWLWLKNEKCYAKIKHQPNRHNLSEQYQLSENIRTGSQLMPTMLCHLVGLFCSLSIVFYVYFDKTPESLVSELIIAFSTFLTLMVEITMITCHPYLRRDFFALLGRVAEIFYTPKGNSVHPAAVTIAAKSGQIVEGQPPKMGIDEHEQHFRMLAQFWEK